MVAFLRGNEDADKSYIKATGKTEEKRTGSRGENDNLSNAFHTLKKGARCRMDWNVQNFLRARNCT